MASFNLPLTRENIAFSLGVFYRRLSTKFSLERRPSSAPYISGDTFRKLADHVYEEGNKAFVYSSVADGDIVFVQTHLLTEFFAKIHPKINSKYILLCHNTDIHLDKAVLPFIDERIMHVFSENVSVRHKKVQPIPIGLENLSYHNHGETYFFSALQSKKSEKKNRILFGFSVSTNPKERSEAQFVCRKLDIADEIVGRLNTRQYLEQLQRYKFVISPPGNGTDCIRTWEAMYLGVIPIVKRGVAMEAFVRLGLPLFIVDSWKELESFSENDLARRYERIYYTANTSALYFDYWKGRIEYVKRQLHS